jgi:hypothetical protein
LITTCVCAAPEEAAYLWTEYDESRVALPEPLKSGCGALSLDPNSAKTYKPNFPVDGFKAKTSGFAVFDFLIDENGKPKDIINVAVSDKASNAFRNESQKALRRLKFTLTDEWASSCANQRYRIGYAFRLMTDCSYKEFPKPTINVCVTGVMEKIHGVF